VTDFESVQKAGFVLGDRSRCISSGDDERLRAASVMKPLLFWAASPALNDPVRWERLARAAVTVSDNDATVEVWKACGGRALLTELSARSGAEFPLEPGGIREFGRVLVDAGAVARAYEAMARDPGRQAALVLGWMRRVQPSQTFGLRSVVASRLSLDASEVGVKCGWSHDDDEDRIRTHAVTVTSSDFGIVGTCVLTAMPMTAADRDAYAAAGGRNDEELPVHERIAGGALRRATMEVLEELGL
jgi:hypothetical protein